VSVNNVALMLQSPWHALTKPKHVWISCVASETTANRFAVTCQLHLGDDKGNCNGSMF